jgi:hypothetical protein
MIVLTRGNAPNVLSVRNREHPEWGTFRFNYNAQRLTDGYYSTIESGSNCRVLFWNEYDHWEVVSLRSPIPFSPVAVVMGAFAQAGWDFAKGDM